MANVLVIGGGAAGMMAALSAAECGHNVRLLEKNEKLGKKLYITGKGRCNFTNACDFAAFQANVVSNPKFLFSSLRAFGPEDMISFLEEEGCRTKIERGQRAFPLSDHASDVTRALSSRLQELGVRVELNTEVTEIGLNEGRSPETLAEDTEGGPRFSIAARCGREKKRRVFSADRIIIATGGLSYPSTGSTGDGYRFAEKFGIGVAEASPALVPLEVSGSESVPENTALKNVTVRIFETKKPEAGGTEKMLSCSEPGELLFMKNALSGPLILSASSDISRGLAAGDRYRIEIDLKPALSDEMLDARLLRDFEAMPNTDLEHALSKLLISALRSAVLNRSGVSGEKKVRDVTRKERTALLHAVKHLSFDIRGTRGFSEAIVTQGGIRAEELNPKTMESRKVRGLSFAGEVIDVDAYTGGFNLQIAWSTGRAAGTNVAW